MTLLERPAHCANRARQQHSCPQPAPAVFTACQQPHVMAVGYSVPQSCLTSKFVHGCESR